MREVFTMLHAKIPAESNTAANSRSSKSGSSVAGARGWAYPSSLSLAALVSVVASCILYFTRPTPDPEWLDFRAGGWSQALALCLAFLVLWALFSCIFTIVGKIVHRSRTPIALAARDIAFKPLKWYAIGAIICMLLLVGAGLLRTHHVNIVLFTLGLICVLVWLWPRSWPVRWWQSWLEKRRIRPIGTSFACLTDYFPPRKTEQKPRTDPLMEHGVQRNEYAARR